MNTGSDTCNPHLDLGDLIAGAAGQPVDDPARQHLAGCEHCQLEAKRWNLVADGVRALIRTRRRRPRLPGRGAPVTVSRLRGGVPCWWPAPWPQRSSSSWR